MFGDNGDAYTPSSGDDESGSTNSGGAYFPDSGPGDADNRPPPGTSEHRTFWDWLLNRRGRDNEGRPQSQDQNGDSRDRGSDDGSQDTN